MKHLTIIIPIYNEEAILETEVTAMVKELDEQFRDAYEILLVENGSFDRTRQITQSLERQFPQLRIIYLPTAGYGRALKEGLLQSNGEFTVLFNIDFWNVPFVKKALDLQKEKNLDMVVGSKTAPGAEDTRPFVRRAITRTFNWLLKKLFGFRGTDTHGMKLMDTEKLKPIIAACQTEREIFDTEFVLRAEAAGLKTEEIPVVCVEKRKTVYRITQRIPRTLKDLVTLFFSFRLPQFSKVSTGLVIFSIFFFLFSVFYGFPDSPSPWFDNGVNLGLARTYAEDGVYSLRLAPGDYIRERALFISTNYPLVGWIILSFKILGVGLWQAQIVMILFLILYLIAAALLVTRWYGRGFAAGTLALIVTFLPFYGNGLSGGLGEVPGLVYLLFGLLLYEKEKRWPLFFCGFLLGLAATTKVIYVLLLAGIAAAEIWRAVQEKKLLWRRWFVLVIGLTLSVMVWLATVTPRPFTFDAVKQTLAYYANPYDAAGVVSENLRRFVTESTPLHFVLLLISFLISLFIRFKKKILHPGEIVLSAFILLNIIFYLRTVGWYRYLFPAHLLLLTLTAPAIFFLAKEFFALARARHMAATVVILLALVQGVHAVRHRNEGLYYNSIPRLFAQTLNTTLPQEASIMVVDKPELWFLLPRAAVTQRMKMNPRVSFGEDIFATGNLPDYIVSGEPSDNEYLRQYTEELEKEYERVREEGAYVLLKREYLSPLPR